MPSRLPTPEERWRAAYAAAKMRGASAFTATLEAIPFTCDAYAHHHLRKQRVRATLRHGVTYERRLFFAHVLRVLPPRCTIHGAIARFEREYARRCAESLRDHAWRGRGTGYPGAPWVDARLILRFLRLRYPHRWAAILATLTEDEDAMLLTEAAE